MTSDATLEIGSEPIGTISPRLYGHFAEHLGQCCYGGLWVGEDGAGAAAGADGVPVVDGFRADVVEALKALPMTLLRWPGGCYADHYHWRDGIGPARRRRQTLGMSCGLQVPDDNSLGTHEFLRLCELTGAEPYLAGNVGSGTVQEFCDWVEYVNSGIDAAVTRERAANGRPSPWGVRLWGVGNESWDCGGRFDPVHYAREYRRYASLARHVDPGLELVAVGLEDEGAFAAGMDRDWNRKFLAELGWSIDLVDHLSIHRYWSHGGPEVDFGEDDYYRLLAEAAGTEDTIVKTARLLSEVAPGRKIGVALDEWGVWHPEARPWGAGDVPRRTPVTFEQANTLRDGICAAIALEGFHRHCGVLSMANLAQVVNILQSVLLTDGVPAVKTPTYHVFAMHRPHIGAEALPARSSGGAQLPSGEPAVTATASRSDSGLAVTVLNRHFQEAATIRIPHGGAATLGATLLTAGAANAHNTRGDPERVVPVPVSGTVRGDSWTIELPEHSVLTVEFGTRG